MKKGRTGINILGICLALALCTKALAADDIVVAGNYTNDEDISLYVKGLEAGIQEVSCQIGTKTGQQVTFEDTADMENALKTLIMIDNSLSITESNREKIHAFLMAFTGKKDAEERVAIAVFDETLKIVTDFTADGQKLEEAVSSIVYQNQETYLTDVLYEVMKNGQLGSEDSYKKIIIISDGVDNKTIGYTKEELYGQIKEKAYPIYTLGCIYNNNEEQLKNMFALSRLTGGKEFLLDEEDDMELIAEEIRKDSQAVHFRIVPEEEEMDGSTNQILLTVRYTDGERKIETGVKMPFQEEGKVIPEAGPETDMEQVMQSEREDRLEGIKVMAGIAAAVAAVFLIVLFVQHKRRRRLTRISPVVLDRPERDSEATVLMAEGEKDTEKTELLSDYEDDGKTEKMGDRQYVLYLTDEKNPVKSFMVPVKDMVIIGKRRQEVNLLIDYDRSVSGRHCRVSRMNDRFYVEDMNSTNGTLLNGERVKGKKEIYSGCVLTLGRLDMKVEIRCE